MVPYLPERQNHTARRPVTTVTPMSRQFKKRKSPASPSWSGRRRDAEPETARNLGEIKLSVQVAMCAVFSPVAAVNPNRTRALASWVW